MTQKIGIGYDIHRLVKGRKLVLGGVEVPHAKGLDGHSDADVIVHAVCDALLGALGLGDIGEHFPNTDKKYKDISSLKLLKTVHGLVQKSKYKIGNLDVIVQAQEPKLQEFKPQMKKAIAKSLEISPESVNIKATTQEGVGSIGRKEAIASFAAVLLVKEE